MAEIVFPKSGSEIKAAIEKRRAQLQARLQRRNRDLEAFMRDGTKVRSYMVRSAQADFVHGRNPYVLVPETDVSSEERREIGQLCRRIFEIEQELHRLTLITMHLRDEQVTNLTFDDLVAYGFDTTLEAE